MQGQENRREFVRQDDEVLLRIRPLDQTAYDAIVEDFERWRLDYHFGENRTNTNRHLQPAFRKIEHEMPEVADYLLSLERKIDNLTRQLSTGPCANDAGTPTLVNLSAQGIRCPGQARVGPGDRVEVALLLLPRQDQIVALGRVIDSESTPNKAGAPTPGDSTLAIEFEHIGYEDREALIRHVCRLERERLIEERREAG